MPGDQEMDEPSLMAGTPLAVRRVDAGRSISGASAVRISVLVVALIVLLLLSTLGISWAASTAESTLGIEMSDVIVDELVYLAIPASFVVVLAGATSRHRLRNWLAGLWLGGVDVTVTGRRVPGEEMEVSVASPRLGRVGDIEVIHKLVRVEGIDADRIARRASGDGGVISRVERRLNRYVVHRAVFGADNEVVSRTPGAVKLGDPGERPATAANAVFSVPESLGDDAPMVQILEIAIDMPWWFDWHAKVLIRASQS